MRVATSLAVTIPPARRGAGRRCRPERRASPCQSLRVLLTAALLLLLLLPRQSMAEEAAPPPDITPSKTAAARERRPDGVSPALRVTPGAAAGLWIFTQLIPSPLYVATSDRVGGGVRWQVTPLLYSFGVAAKPVRAFVIEPVARHSGAVELYVSPEWACCAPGDGTSWIARGGARLYLPLVGRGEALTGSLGGSYYRASDGSGASVEMGVHMLFSMLGLTVTVSPRLTGREVIGALHIRYF